MPTPSEVWEQWQDAAWRMGADAGHAAGSWVEVDDAAQALCVLDLAQNCELDLPSPLSGEWAGDPTPRDLFEVVTSLDAHAEASWNFDAYTEAVNTLCDAYESGFVTAYEAEVIRAARYQLGEVTA